MISAYGNVNPGYGVSAAFNLHRGALEKFVPVDSHDIRRPQVGDYNLLYVHGLPGQIQYLIDLYGEGSFRAKKVIAYWVCESDGLSEMFHHYANYVDEIWTASSFCASVFESLGKPVKVVPHAVSHLSYGVNGIPFTFYFEFDGSSRILRKNPFGLIEAFKLAWSPDDEVRLHIKAKNTPKAFIDEMKARMEGYSFELTESYLGPAEKVAFWDHVGCFVSLHRGEGFGLSILEAMGMGVPVIATGWSGNMDFMSKDLGNCVAYDLVPCEDRYYAGMWAEPNLRHAADLMHRVTIDNGWSENVRRTGLGTACDFTPANTIKKTMEAIV